MESGFKILWTSHALEELSDAYKYLELYFTERELKNLSIELDKSLQLISENPYLFPISELKGVRKIVIKKYNTLYYRKHKNHIEILSFFSNRQNPNKKTAIDK